MSAMEELCRMTYAVEHNPNCRMPFMVRLAGRAAAAVDFKPPEWTDDVLGYGKTMEGAARRALSKRKRQQKIPLRRLLVEREKHHEPRLIAVGYR